MVSRTAADHLVAALREALTNASKHASSRRVDVIVEIDEADVLLLVTDDGIGVSADAGRRSGLSNLSSRALDLGGACTLERVSDDGGSRLRWRVPLADA